jgi:hypothetical protein
MVFHGSSSGLSTEPDEVISGDEDAPENLGAGVQAASDLDLDGFEDVLVARSDLNDNLTWSWFRGGPGGLAEVPGWIADGELVSGDFTGDGFVDIARTTLGGGSVDVYPGSASGPAAAPSWTIDRPVPRLGAADATGDGVLDLGVLPYSSGPQSEIEWYDLTAGSTEPAAATPGPSMGRVDGLGDLDGDGLDDWAVSNPAFETVLFLGSSPAAGPLPGMDRCFPLRRAILAELADVPEWTPPDLRGRVTLRRAPRLHHRRAPPRRAPPHRRCPRRRPHPPIQQAPSSPTSPRRRPGRAPGLRRRRT